MAELLTLLEGHSPTLVVLIISSAAYIIYAVLNHLIISYRRYNFRKGHGCLPIPSYPHKEPVFGLDLFFENAKLSRTGGFVNATQKRYHNINGGVNTFSMLFLGDRVINTCEPENIKAILATKFKDFSLPTRRKAALDPTFGHGIFTTDGTEWEESRALLRPNFSRSLVGDLTTFEEHIEKMIAKIPRNGATVDLQKLFFMLTMDSATDFLFGQSANVLGEGESSNQGRKFTEAFDYVTEKCGLIARLGKLVSIFPDKKFNESNEVVHQYAQNYVRHATKRQKRLADEEKQNPSRYVFSEELGKTGQSAKKIQDELLNVLLAGRDTTASLLAHLWHILARRPDVFEKLRSEVLSLDGRTPTFEQIKELKYLQYTLNETLRLHPIVPINARKAVVDTFLPVGGGPDGKSSVFVKAGTQVNYQVWVMHRRRDLYGEDAEEFKPERWVTLRPSWHYLPFNGGPRICIGQQFALTEAAYATIRLLQHFKSIQARDTSDYQELLTLTMVVRGGVQVGLTPA